MNRSKRTLVLFVLALCLSYMTSAQTLVETLGVSKKREYSGFFDSYYYRGPLSITGGVGTSIYMGDLSNHFYGTPGLGFSLGLNYKFWPRVMFGVEFQHQALSGKSKDSIPVSFTGVNWGLNFYGRFYLVEDIIRKSPDRRTNKKVKPYITAGVGFTHFNAKGTYSSASGITPAFPAGLGIEFKISQRFQVMPEYTHTFTFNDRLDAASYGGGKDGYGMILLKLQYAPFAPKKKKKVKSAPADPNQHREEHQEWRKKKEKPKPVEEEYKTPGEENNNEEQPENGDGTEENNEEKPTDETPVEEEKPEGN
ncbi:MAG TPA: outer membrane beta-barrel protein [Cytophagaceae bacterium]|nr:outer membrane beta-barrel protein [Cytophagaceae bacterium]